MILEAELGERQLSGRPLGEVGVGTGFQAAGGDKVLKRLKGLHSGRQAGGVAVPVG